MFGCCDCACGVQTTRLFFYRFFLFFACAIRLDFFFKGSGSHAHFCPTALFEHASDGPSRQPTDTEDHTMCTPCSDAHFVRATTACVSSPRDWAVSKGSHTQLDTVVSSTPPRLGAPFPWLRTCRNLDPRIGGDVFFGVTCPSSLRVATRVFPPRRAPVTAASQHLGLIQAQRNKHSSPSP